MHSKVKGPAIFINKLSQKMERLIGFNWSPILPLSCKLLMRLTNILVSPYEMHQVFTFCVIQTIPLPCFWRIDIADLCLHTVPYRYRNTRNENHWWSLALQNISKGMKQFKYEKKCFLTTRWKAKKFIIY